jgi:hypothetical protein
MRKSIQNSIKFNFIKIKKVDENIIENESKYDNYKNGFIKISRFSKSFNIIKEYKYIKSLEGNNNTKKKNSDYYEILDPNVTGINNENTSINAKRINNNVKINGGSPNAGTPNAGTPNAGTPNAKKINNGNTSINAKRINNNVKAKIINNNVKAKRINNGNNTKKKI